MSFRSVVTGIALASLIAAGFTLTRDSGPKTPARSLGGSNTLSAPITFRFAAIGDFGTGTSAQRVISDELRKRTKGRRMDALLTTGDNIYPSGNPVAFDSAWHSPYAWVAKRKIPVIASLGNHDIATAGGRDVMALFNMPDRWYSKRIADAEIIVLDANDPFDEDQRTWLAETLAASTAAWQIVLFHQPAYSCSAHGSTSSVIANWVPIFEEGGVDLVLNGHDHNYQRFAPLNGTTYVVTGGGGAPLYRLRQCTSETPPRLVAREAHHYLTMAGHESELRLRAYGPGGRFDEVLLER